MTLAVLTMLMDRLEALEKAVRRLERQQQRKARR